MKRVTIITFLAVLLCALAACGSTQVGSTGGDTNTGSLLGDDLRGEHGDDFAGTAGKHAVDDAQEANVKIIGTDEPTSSAESGAASGSAPFQVSAAELAGPWHLDGVRNDLSNFSNLFECYAEFGARMEIRSGGQLSWYIGAEGGEGTCSVNGSLLTAELSRTVDECPMTTEFDILRDGDEIYLGMHWTNGIVFWSWGDDESANLSGNDALLSPGEDVVELVNLRGDETTVYKLDDGRYMDRTSTVFIFDGVDTWTDENGVEWNKTVR